MNMRAGLVCISISAALWASVEPARAGEEYQGTQGNPPAQVAAPSTTVTNEINDNQIHDGVAGQLIAPTPPNSIPPSHGDQVLSSTSAPAPNPVPTGCPPGFGYLPPSGNYAIYPSFTRNASGAYDGHDAEFGYNMPNAIPAGGDPAQTSLYAPATAANISGHFIAVDLSVVGPTSLGAPNARVPAVPNSGTCDGGAISWGFSQPFLDGDNPVPAPANITPPFDVGTALAAAIMGHWRIGTIGTLPGPGNATRTYVHIPTCAWLDSGVPTAPVHLHTINTAPSNGYTLFLIYDITVTPGGVTWDWGDSTQTTSTDTPTAAPPALPAYDASTQTWSNPCTVSHSYASVSAGRTITATESFTTTITVSWSNGVSAQSSTLPCDPSSGGPCTMAIGPSQGWRSGPHPVDQIEPVPFNPSAAA